MSAPLKYTDALAVEICRRLAEGESLRAICRTEGYPTETGVRKWAIRDENGFAEQYRTARELGYLKMADELVEIADDATNDYMELQRKDGTPYRKFDPEAVARSNLRISVRQWILARMLPKIYGGKDADGDIDTNRPLIQVNFINAKMPESLTGGNMKRLDVAKGNGHVNGSNGGIVDAEFSVVKANGNGHNAKGKKARNGHG